MRLDTRALVFSLFVSCLCTPFGSLAQIAPPKPGVEMPQAYRDRVAVDKTAFQFKNAWIHKAERVRQMRHAYLADKRSVPMSHLSPMEQQQIVVSGTVAVPVFLTKFANTTSTPYPASNLRKELFDGPWPTGTMTDLYTEMSYGNLTLTGTVYNWVTLSQNDTYYEGGCNGICASARTGQLLLEVLIAKDPTVDFGAYDNDGPDGIANSGDDDGFVDFVAFVHPEIGGECGSSNNVWSHRWVVQGWPEFANQPWQTDDPRSGGGFIKVQDYTIQPALGCSGSIIEIGVFCHEFGHAFGLPDLYDTDGGGAGIGHHGLMGSGNWNSPTNPAHMSAWSKAQLGWVMPTVVGPTAQTYTINDVNQNAEAYKLNIMEEKFSRSNVDPIAGSWSLRCGLDASESASRNWPGGAGYGNGWHETIRRDFSFDDTGPVTLEYDIQYDTEANYDHARIKINVGGTVSTLASYTGFGSATDETVDLTPYLSGSGVSSYQIVAEFETDISYSDEDGLHDSGPSGPLKLDNVSVTGAGESYASDFEQHEDGWYYDFTNNPHREYFLVENRSTGAVFDQDLYAEGLMIWHIEENVMNSSLTNTGGTDLTTNLQPAGVTLEEADALRHLLLGLNRGDDGDACPGATGATKFDNTTTPASSSHNGLSTNVLVDNVSAAGPVMTATMRAGWFAPSLTSISPATGDQNTVVQINDISGAGMVYGATFLLRDASFNERAASRVDWIGKAKLAGEIDLTGLLSGNYDVVVRLPDGQEAVLTDGFEVTATVAVLIQDVVATIDGTTVEISWNLWTDESIRGFNIVRRDVAAAQETVINTSLIDPHERVFVDATALPATRYEYVLLVVLEDGDEMRSPPVTAETLELAFSLFQNDPNPFNPLTRIRFSLPETAHARLTVFDLKGRRVATLVDGVRGAGVNEIVWDGKNDAGAPLATGVYFYQLRSKKRIQTRKLVLVK